MEEYNKSLNVDYTFDNFNVDLDNGSAYTITVDLAEKMGRISKPLYLTGPDGKGKTHLLNAMANYIIANDKSVKVGYISVEEFDNELYEAIKNNAIGSFRDKYEALDIFIVDDLSIVIRKMFSKNELLKIMLKLKEAGKLVIAADSLTIEELKERGLPDGYFDVFEGASKVAIE
ncbi:MAG: ATP-binding protein [Lachnospiraceae bacterium]|nr:ATP-binding protein [Lachnospiraceae bacterium]